MSPLKRKKLNKIRLKLDKLDNSLIKLIKQRTNLVNQVLKLKDKRKEIIDNMFDQNEWTIEQFYDEYKTTYPDMVKSFEKYLENKDEDDVVNQVKEKILLELYNEKDTICNKTKT